MEHGDANIAVFFAWSPVNGGYFFVAEEFGHGITTKGDDYLWLNGGYLPIEVVVTGTDLVRKWVAILRWATLDDVGNENVGALEADASK